MTSWAAIAWAAVPLLAPSPPDLAAAPPLSGTLAVVSPARVGPNPPAEGLDMHHLRFNLHAYLAWFDGRLWCVWSDGPHEDQPTQEVRFATSADGLVWEPGGSVTGTPEAPWAYISRGLWIRDGELLALAAHYRGPGAFGADKDLTLEAFRWDPVERRWTQAGGIAADAISNYPPERAPGGEWSFVARDSRMRVSYLVGGVSGLADWRRTPVADPASVPGFGPDEPVHWTLPDGRIRMIFRNNGLERVLFESASADGGRTWSTPAPTDFPSNPSKVFSLQLSTGTRLLFVNADPTVGRRTLYVAASRDGVVFTRLARLDVPTPPPVDPAIARVQHKFRAGIAGVMYPHAVEHDGWLYVVYSRSKVQIEAFRVAVSDLEALWEPAPAAPR